MHAMVHGVKMATNPSVGQVIIPFALRLTTPPRKHGAIGPTALTLDSALATAPGAKQAIGLNVGSEMIPSVLR